jgi:hypothetical protein
MRAAALAFAVFLAAVCEPRAGLAGNDVDQGSRFKYVGGTENVQGGCLGTVALEADAFTYRCSPYAVTIPYRDVETMEYRADVTRRIRRMRVKWTAYPPDRSGGNKNLYFILIYRGPGKPHVLIFEIPPDQMRPYLAEIDLKMGRRVEVQSHENYTP